MAPYKIDKVVLFGGKHYPMLACPRHIYLMRPFYGSIVFLRSFTIR